MRPVESFVGQPVRSLQTMLRVIAEDDRRLPSVIPDGIYGTDTRRAVTAFQKRAGLAANGVVDQQTWDALVPAYEWALESVGEAQPLDIVLDPGQVIRRGERDPNLYIVQGVLTVLAQAYGGIPAPAMTGQLDLATAESLAAFQRLHLLPDTGELDKHTWKRLALQYPLAASLLIRE